MKKLVNNNVKLYVVTYRATLTNGVTLPISKFKVWGTSKREVKELCFDFLHKKVMFFTILEIKVFPSSAYKDTLDKANADNVSLMENQYNALVNCVKEK